MYNSTIKGLGFYVPENTVTNNDLSELMDTSDEWIRERTGIKERRWVNDDKLTTSLMGTYAAERAIIDSGIEKKDIDFIIFSTLSPDYYFPGSGVLLQRNLEIKEVGALDIRNQCSGFIYGLSIADQYIKSGMYKNILVVGSEIHSGGLDKSTRGRSVSVIFGDGAGAAVVSATTSSSGILSTHLHSEGKFAEELAVIKPATSFWIDKIKAETNKDDTSYFPYMNGNFVFKNAVIRFEEVIFEGLNKAQRYYETVRANNNNNAIDKSTVLSFKSKELLSIIETMYKNNNYIDEIHYISIADKRTMEEIDEVNINDGAIISVAVNMGGVRLIDNMLL